MAPEYGASTGCFPIDGQTLAFLRDTGRTAEQVALVEAYARANGLWFDPAAAPRYTTVLDVDLSALGPLVAGPRRPQDRLAAADVRPPGGRGHTRRPGRHPTAPVAIAALTSCTNTTDFGLLVDRRAGGAQGPPAWVAPARLGQDLADAGLPRGPAAAGAGGIAGGPGSGGLRHRRIWLRHLHRQFGAPAAGHGCCRAARRHAHRRAVRQPQLPRAGACAVEQALLASPPLVVAYALAGHARLGRDPRRTGRPQRTAVPCTLPSCGRARRRSPRQSPPAPFHPTCRRRSTPPNRQGHGRRWTAPGGARFPWDPASTYLRRPPFVRLRQRRARTRPWSPTRCWCWATTSPRTTSRRPAPSPPSSDAGAWLVRARRGPGRPERLCLPPRQLGGDAARPVHQPDSRQPSRPRPGRPA